MAPKSDEPSSKPAQQGINYVLLLYFSFPNIKYSQNTVNKSV